MIQSPTFLRSWTESWADNPSEGKITTLGGSLEDKPALIFSTSLSNKSTCKTLYGGNIKVVVPYLLILILCN